MRISMEQSHVTIADAKGVTSGLINPKKTPEYSGLARSLVVDFPVSEEALELQTKVQEAFLPAISDGAISEK